MIVFAVILFAAVIFMLLCPAPLHAASTIPKIIHQTAPSDKSKWPSVWEQCQSSWKRLHPDFAYIMWTDEDIDAFVKANDPDFYDQWKRYDSHIKRVDVVRYLILKEFGGIYADMDYECKERFFERLPKDKVSIAESSYKTHEQYQNALMISPRGHPFWDVVMGNVKRRFHDCTTGGKSNVLYCTGPNVIDAAVTDLRTRPWFNKLSASDYMDKNTARYAAHLGTAVWW